MELSVMERTADTIDECDRALWPWMELRWRAQAAMEEPLTEQMRREADDVRKAAEAGFYAVQRVRQSLVEALASVDGDDDE